MRPALKLRSLSTAREGRPHNQQALLSGQCKAATSTTINPPTASNQSGSPSKRPRRSGPAPRIKYTESDDSRASRSSSNVSEFMEQVAAKDLPSKDSVMLLITRVLNLLSYCTQPFRSQPVVDFRTERQTMRLAIPGVDGPIVTIDEVGQSLTTRPPKGSDSDSDEPGLTREDSQGSNYAEQVRSKDLPPEDSVVLLITRVLNLISYCTQPFGAQPVADFRTERQKMSLQIPGVDGAIIAIDDGGLTLAQAAKTISSSRNEMSARYFETVTSASAFDTQLKAELKHSDGPLSTDDLQASGSNWGRRQLLACRVIVSPTAHNVLPAYEGHTQRIEEVQEIKEFLEGPDPALMHHSTHFLISKYGFSLGEMWAALASVKHYPRPLPRNDGTPEAKRVRRNTVLEGYVSSAGFQISSSDPEERSSPSAGSDGSGGPSYTEQQPTPELPAEDCALLLITRVLRHLLFYTQAPNSSSHVVDFRPERHRMVSDFEELEKQLVAIDDGGLSLKVNIGPSDKPNVAIALLEAKRRLVVDHGKPKMSDECLAQMTCEAILARARSPGEQVDNER
ncbi:hypothetical protein H9Q72_007088 [Fusarium xylarioides]|uniref:Uncharacterized protein n=1 Tax=Fusarium xylarioides TaxID=221167 RepID=A0A9P7HQW9_9HYPO|nr:hypothetical protein H9Q72_007088 [Fusarium xylarioides]